MRKASLELSANAIVILVLALTLLGLGIAFINNVFKNLTSTSIEVSDQAKEAILDDLRSGNKQLSFPTSSITVEKGENKVLAIGLKNIGAMQDVFVVQILTSTGTIVASNVEDTVGKYTFTYRGGTYPARSTCTTTSTESQCLVNAKPLAADQPEIIPILYRASNAAPAGTTLFVVRVMKLTNGRSGSAWSWLDQGPTSQQGMWGTVYAQKDFFITVK